MATGGSHVCTPVRGAGLCKCNKYGQAINVYKKCQRCNELRCRSRCGCARRGTLTGRSRGRNRSCQLLPVAVKAKPAPGLPVAAAKAKPAPRPQASQLKIFSHLSSDSWLDDLTKEVPKASEMVLCTYAYDDAALHRALLGKVSSGDLKLKVVVDRRYLNSSGAPYYSKGRLDALAKAGAEVRAGGAAASNMHYKIAVLSGPQSYSACYHGGSNATQASRQSWECTVRYQQPEVVKEFKLICMDCFDKATALQCNLGLLKPIFFLSFLSIYDMSPPKV